MDRAIINPDLSVTIEHDAAIPIPKEWEVVIKVDYAAINPADWKFAMRSKTPSPAPGKDFAGHIHAVGSKVLRFKTGDRVGAFNVTSGYAEYSVAPTSTVYKLPDHVSFEQAALYGLPYYTAALGLFKNMPMRAPWNPARPSDHNPLVIYGASSAVGAYAVKLAVLANIHPIIAVAGTPEIIKGVMKPEYGDTIVNYHEHENLVAAIKSIGTVKYAFDVVADEYSMGVLAQVLDAEVSYYASALEVEFKGPSKTEASLIWAPNLFMSKGNEVDGPDNVGSRAHTSVVSAYLEFALGEGLIQPHIYEILPNGLGSLEEGLKRLRDGKSRSLRYVLRCNHL